MKFIVEHLEPECDEWSLLEYRNIASKVGPENLILSGLDKDLIKKLDVDAQLSSTGVLELCKTNAFGLDFNKVLLCDPASTVPLSPQDAANYDALLFGGILGDDPPRDRTKELRDLGFSTRHLGPVQMTTDTACMAAHRVFHDQIPLEDLKIVDRPVIRLGKKEEVEMPFRYLLGESGPILPLGMMDLLRRSNEMSLN
jgi:ribosome biogenesis SPOUT family RNA methylase Rps3